MSTVIQMTSGFSFTEIRSLMDRAIGTNFGYDLRCQGTNGPATHAELEVLGLSGEYQALLTKMFVDQMKPIIGEHFGKFEVTTK